MSQTPPRAGVPVQDQSVLDRAVHLHRAGQLAEAQALYEQVLEADPDHAGAIHAIGLLTHQGGDSAGALRLLSRSIELEPGNADFHNNLGVVLKQLSRYEDAAAALRQAIALNGAHADAHLNLGDVLRKLGRDDEAERMQRRAEELRPIREMPLHEAMSMGMWLHRHGQLVEAQEVYDHILAAAPDHADALHFRGVLAHQLGERERALELVRRAASLAPHAAPIQNNLGNMLKESGLLDEATAAYERAIELDPANAEAHNNLGIVLRGRNQVNEAIASFRRAITSNPRHAEAYHNLGNVLRVYDRHEEAFEAYRKAIELEPARSQAYNGLCLLLMRQGKPADARAVVDEWISMKPDDPVAKHMRAALTGEDVPDRATDDYVQQLFDRMASTFDDHLVRSLAYRAPQLVADAAMRAMAAAEASLDVLDAGCGTGLCGPPLRAAARRLIGVDLSQGMIDRARHRKVYDELVQAELTAFLRQRADAFDLIVSADTLNYFGDLHPVYEAAAAALRPGGRFVFTLERADEPHTDGEPTADAGGRPDRAGRGGRGFKLNTHGRYSHRESDTRTLLDACGLSVQSLTVEVLRKEEGEPVEGLLVVAGR